MAAYFLRRLLLMIPTFLGVTLIIFGITRIVPGGPLEQEMMRLRMGAGKAGLAGAQGEIPKEAMDELKKAFDLDKPWLVAYGNWLYRLVNGNFGNSYRFREPVSRLIVDRFPISIYFGLTGFLLAYLICIPLGIFKAIYHGSFFDLTTSAIVFIGYSIPGWALGAVLLVLFAGGRFHSFFPLGGFHSSTFDELPESVREAEDYDLVTDEFGTFDWKKLSPRGKVVDVLHHTTLPIIAYIAGSFATLTVITKNSMLENLGQEYVRTAFAKGLAPTRVIFLHTLRNSMIPLATGLGHAVGLLMAGSYLIEFVFNIDGIGFLGYNSLVGRDYTVVMGILSINTLLMLLGNIIADFLYAMVDPRIRFN